MTVKWDVQLNAPVELGGGDLIAGGLTRFCGSSGVVRWRVVRGGPIFAPLLLVLEEDSSVIVCRVTGQVERWSSETSELMWRLSLEGALFGGACRLADLFSGLETREAWLYRLNSSDAKVVWKTKTLAGMSSHSFLEVGLNGGKPRRRGKNAEKSNFRQPAKQVARESYKFEFESSRFFSFPSPLSPFFSLFFTSSFFLSFLPRPDQKLRAVKSEVTLTQRKWLEDHADELVQLPPLKPQVNRRQQRLLLASHVDLLLGSS